MLSWFHVEGAKSRVFVMRHCVRATTHDGEVAGYAATPMPAWPVPPDWCTPRGLEIVRATGAHLVKDFGVDPDESAVRIFADSIMRDADTAQALVMGMGLPRVPVTYDAVLFNALKPTVGEPFCIHPTRQALALERVERRSVVPVPWDLDSAIAELQAIIGVGPMGPIAALGGLEFDADGKPTGSAAVVKAFGQIMLYAYASGISFANVTEDQAMRFVAWQHWHRSISSWGSKAATANSLLLRHVLSSLRGHAETDIFVGHDGNIDGIGALLDLTWEAPPYLGGQLHPTPPGSGLLFEMDLDDKSVEISYVYRAFNNTDREYEVRRSHVRSTSLAAIDLAARQGLQRFPGAMECFEQSRGIFV